MKNKSVYLCARTPRERSLWEKILNKPSVEVRKSKMLRTDAENFMSQVAMSGGSNYISYFIEEIK